MVTKTDANGTTLNASTCFFAYLSAYSVHWIDFWRGRKISAQIVHKDFTIITDGQQLPLCFRLLAGESIFWESTFCGTVECHRKKIPQTTVTVGRLCDVWGIFEVGTCVFLSWQQKVLECSSPVQAWKGGFFTCRCVGTSCFNLRRRAIYVCVFYMLITTVSGTLRGARSEFFFLYYCCLVWLNCSFSINNSIQPVHAVWSA